MGKDSKKVFISWIGNTDIKNVWQNDEEERGPLLSILFHYKKNFFDEAILLHSDSKGSQPSIDKIKTYVKTRVGRCTLRPYGSINPADPSAIYEVELKVLSSFPKGTEFYYGLTSGTPAMYAVQLLMSSKFPGIPLYSVKPEHRKTNTPLAIPVILPDLLPVIDTSSDDSDVLAVANKDIFSQVRTKIAKTSASVLITGEIGAGKSTLAMYIHNESGRSDKEFVSVNCAEFADDHARLRSELFGYRKGDFPGADKDRKGKFELANNSTLFLNEIGELPLSLQGMLLNALESETISPVGNKEPVPMNVRIVATTSRELLPDVKSGRFRLDLYYRLAQYSPRLRSVRTYSRSEKEKLLDCLLNDINQKWFPGWPKFLSDDARKVLLDQPWHGNIREMKFRLTSICLLSDQEVTLADVSQQLSFSMEGIENDSFLPENLNAWIDERKKCFAKRALELCGNKDAAAAQRLGMNPSTFRSMKQKYNL